MPERPRLTAERRDVIGKSVKRLRLGGRVPANLVETLKASIPLQIDERELAAVVRRGQTGHLVELQWDGSSEPVLLDHVEVHAISNRMQHAIFRRVDLNKSVNVTVPVHFEGASPASQSAELAVIHVHNELHISALPAEIPSYLIADITTLVNAGDAVTIGDLRAADGRFEPLLPRAEHVAVVHHARIAVAEVEEAPAAEGAEVAEDAVEEGEKPEEG